MNEPRYRYAVHVLREDDTPVRQVPVELDWEPAREWLRLQALRSGRSPEEAFTLDCAIEPVWHPARGQPYLGGFRVRAAAAGCEEEFGLGYFSELSRGVTTRLVKEAALQPGDLIRCLPVAFPLAAAAAAAAPPDAAGARLGKQAPPALKIEQASLAGLLNGNGPPNPESADALPVLIPERVLEEISTLTLAAEGRETGGVLIGRLHRDNAPATLFAEVAAQIPARHTEASATRLSFTAATWTGVQAALDLRTRSESMLGWWHSHPVKQWCKNCPEEKRRRCSLARGFLSEEDRLLHRTVFPRAYSLALLANDVEDGPTFSLFGWSRGVLAPREFHRLAEASHA
jgi:hypothetical protein